MIRRPIDHRAVRQAVSSFVLGASLIVGVRAQASFAVLDPLAQWDGTTGEVGLHDLDGDGDLDLVQANGGGGTSGGAFAGMRLGLNDGFGAFVDVSVSNLPASGGPAGRFEVGDVDGDGDPDLVVALSSPTALLQVWENLGGARFVLRPAALPAGVPYGEPELFDVDSDGDFDLAVGVFGAPFGPGAQNLLLVNDGRGVFADETLRRLPSSLDRTRTILACDVDGDGDRDLVVGNAGGGDRLLLNSAGVLVERPGALPVVGPTLSLEALDAEADGDLDLVGLVDGGVVLYRNDGAGGFARSPGLPANTTPGAALAVGDVDLDGDADVVAGTFRVYVNDGAGRFVDRASSLVDVSGLGTLFGTAHALGDVDHDGDPDLVAGQVGIDLLFSNLHRHLDTPTLARIGRPFRIDAYVRDGTAAGSVDVAVWLSPRRVAIPWPPFGVFGLDPASLVELPAIRVPFPAGNARSTLSIPTLPGLAGIQVHLQGIVLRPRPTRSRTTNVTTDTILR